MFNLGPLEVLAIMVVALLVFGPQKLPEMGRQVGRLLQDFRRFQDTLQSEVRDVLGEEQKQQPSSPRLPRSWAAANAEPAGSNGDHTGPGSTSTPPADAAPDRPGPEASPPAENPAPRDPSPPAPGGDGHPGPPPDAGR